MNRLEMMFEIAFMDMGLDANLMSEKGGQVKRKSASDLLRGRGVWVDFATYFKEAKEDLEKAVKNLRQYYVNPESNSGQIYAATYVANESLKNLKWVAEIKPDIEPTDDIKRIVHEAKAIAVQMEYELNNVKNPVQQAAAASVEALKAMSQSIQQ